MSLLLQALQFLLEIIFFLVLSNAHFIVVIFENSHLLITSLVNLQIRQTFTFAFYILYLHVLQFIIADLLLLIQM